MQLRYAGPDSPAGGGLLRCRQSFRYWPRSARIRDVGVAAFGNCRGRNPAHGQSRLARYLDRRGASRQSHRRLVAHRRGADWHRQRAPRWWRALHSDSALPRRIPARLNAPARTCSNSSRSPPWRPRLQRPSGHWRSPPTARFPQTDFAENWWTWWQGDTTGIIIVTPLILTATFGPAGAWSARKKDRGRGLRDRACAHRISRVRQCHHSRRVFRAIAAAI